MQIPQRKERPPNAQLKWLALGEASKLLGVKEATLRLWADRGLVRTFRTAGRHRRFAREDLERLMRDQGTRLPSSELADHAVRKLRRYLKSPKATSPDLRSLDTDTVGRLRVLGRWLVEVATRYHSERRRRPDLLEEARFIGREYAKETAKLGFSLPQAVESFFSHRAMLNNTMQGLTPAYISGGEALDMLRDVAEFTDAVLLALVSGYDQSPAATTSSQPKGKS